MCSISWLVVDVHAVVQEKQTKEALTRKQQKGKKKGLQEEESHEAPELLKRPREYTVKFTFPNPPPLSPPILGLHCKSSTAQHSTLRELLCLIWSENLQRFHRFSLLSLLQAWTLATTVRSFSLRTWTLALTWSPGVSLLLRLDRQQHFTVHVFAVHLKPWWTFHICLTAEPVVYTGSTGVYKYHCCCYWLGQHHMHTAQTTRHSTHIWPAHSHTGYTYTPIWLSLHRFLELSAKKSESQSLHHRACVCVSTWWLLPLGGKKTCNYLLVAANPFFLFFFFLKKNANWHQSVTQRWATSCISAVVFPLRRSNITNRKVSAAFQWFLTLILWCICKDCCWPLICFSCQLVFGVVEFCLTCCRPLQSVWSDQTVLAKVPSSCCWRGKSIPWVQICNYCN